MEISTRKSAIEKGSPTYFTGNSCRNGHLSYRYTQSGTCSGCISDASRKTVKEPSAPILKVRDDFVRRKEALMLVTEMRVRCHTVDWPKLRSFVTMLLLTRHPDLKDSDIIGTKLSVYATSDTFLYKINVDPADFHTIRDLSNVLMSQHRPDRSSVDRELQKEMDKLDAGPKPWAFKP